MKWLQFSMNWEDLREMPIEHTSEVKEEQIPDILYYCRNDILSTKEFYWITKGETELKLYKGVDKIQLRGGRVLLHSKRNLELSCLDASVPGNPQIHIDVFPWVGWFAFSQTASVTRVDPQYPVGGPV